MAEDQKLQEAVAFFEQMLQTMPGDRTSLEFLSVAYEQTGQDDKRRECLIRLADCLLAEKDYDNAQAIAVRLSQSYSDPEARATVERVAEVIQSQILESYQRPAAPRSAEAPAFAAAAGGGGFQDQGLEVHALSGSATAAEIDLVWLWREREWLPKETCMDVLHVLTDRPVSDVPMLVSALALLDEQHPELTDGLLEAMQRASELPPVPLELFEIPAAVLQLLPVHFVHVKGVLPFGLVGGEALVALLNPLNPALREETAARLGRPCHFFLAHPRVWQQIAQNFI